MKWVSIYIMPNAICYCNLLEVCCFKILLWPMDEDNWYNENTFKSVVSNFFHLETNRSSQKRWTFSVAHLNLLRTYFLSLCYLQQLFIYSGSANHRLKNTILVTHCFAFHLAPLTVQTKKMMSPSERTWSQRSHIKHYFVFTQQQNINL